MFTQIYADAYLCYSERKKKVTFKLGIFPFISWTEWRSVRKVDLPK